MKKEKMKTKLVAPCGINCNFCLAYLREKNKCPGCRFMGKVNVDSCKKYIRKCIIRNCEKMKKNGWMYCSGKCIDFPCNRLNSLNKRYENKYGVSPIKNLKLIESEGIKKFIKSEDKKWVRGNKALCIHNKKWYKVGD